jgi:AraC-like DNA-binding protein
MDGLTTILDSLRLESSVYCRSELHAPWSLHFEAIPCATFHVVDSGEATLQQDGEQIRLGSGDIVLLPRGNAHTISHAPGYPPYVNIRLTDTDVRGCQRRKYDKGGAFSTLICGSFGFEHASHPLFELLPDLLLIRSSEYDRGSWLETLLKLLSNEAGSERPGADAIVKRLADVLFVQIIRLWLERPDNASRSWIGALRDPAIGRALSLIHSCPEQDWTVATLATEVALSRSAFAARFTALVGMSPIDYLTRWRMEIAARLLRDDRLDLAGVATRVGYESDAAFSKAFKRAMGINPGSYRRAGRNAAPQPEALAS